MTCNITSTLQELLFTLIGIAVIETTRYRRSFLFLVSFLNLILWVTFFQRPKAVFGDNGTGYIKTGHLVTLCINYISLKTYSFNKWLFTSFCPVNSTCQVSLILKLYNYVVVINNWYYYYLNVKIPTSSIILSIPAIAWCLFVLNPFTCFSVKLVILNIIPNSTQRVVYNKHPSNSGDWNLWIGCD